MADTPPKKLRGFAVLKAEGRVAELEDISSAGGRAAHACGRAHEFTSEEAKEAGRKGGKACHAKHPGRMREIGARGAAARIENRFNTTAELSPAAITEILHDRE